MRSRARFPPEAYLQSSVTRLKPRIGFYESALESYQTADSLDCAEKLSQAEDAKSVCLRARALIRCGKAAEAIESLSRLCGFGSRREAGEAFAIRALAEISSGRVDDADHSLLNARALVFSFDAGPLEAEVHYASAFQAWIRGSVDDALRSIDAVFSVPDMASPDSYPLTLSYWRGRAFELRSMSHGPQNRDCTQAKFSMKAFDEFERGCVRDRYAEAALLYNAGILVRDFDLPELRATVARKLESFPWTAPLQTFEYFAHHFLSIRASFEGDHLNALRYLRRSADCANTVSLRLQIALDRYLLLKSLGEQLSASDELEYARRLTAQINWSSVSVQERDVLLKLAQVTAISDPTQARALFSKYVSGSKSHSGGTSIARSMFASDRFTEGIILRAEGEKKRAVLHLLEALRIFSDHGADRQVTLVASELAELTGEERYFNIVRESIMRYPQSPIARRFQGINSMSAESVHT